MRAVGGTLIPICRANSIIINSFSGTPVYIGEGNFTIQPPPTPSIGIVNPLSFSQMAENLSCTPASENRNTPVSSSTDIFSLEIS